MIVDQTFKDEAIQKFQFEELEKVSEPQIFY